MGGEAHFLQKTKKTSIRPGAWKATHGRPAFGRRRVISKEGGNFVPGRVGGCLYLFANENISGRGPSESWKGLRFEPTSVDAPDTFYQHRRDTRSPGSGSKTREQDQLGARAALGQLSAGG